MAFQADAFQNDAFQQDGAGTPEIDIFGNGVEIPNGSLVPSVTNHTDFGVSYLAGTGVSRVFTVQNNGTGPLTVVGITTPTGFTLVEGLPISIAASEEDTFTLQSSTASLGTISGEVVVETDDVSETLYTFTITSTIIPFSGGGDRYASLRGVIQPAIGSMHTQHFRKR